MKNFGASILFLSLIGLHVQAHAAPTSYYCQVSLTESSASPELKNVEVPVGKNVKYADSVAIPNSNQRLLLEIAKPDPSAFWSISFNIVEPTGSTFHEVSALLASFENLPGAFNLTSASGSPYSVTCAETKQL